MELKILEESKDFLKLEIIGEDHTLANALRKELWNDSHVKIAGYNIEHPLIGSPILMVDTDGKEDPKKALFGAADRLKKLNLEFLSKFK
jgi:DNA-directed RNA polymerase subunit L